MIEYANKNKYGYVIIAVQIDPEWKTATLYHGSTAPLAKSRKANRKFVYDLFTAYKENPCYTVKEF
jgi:hypothetical protein